MTSISPLKNSKLKEKIHNDFIHRIIPVNILSVIKKYGPGVLTDRDVDHIRSVSNTRGKISGAEELLEYMARYENWFPCLLQALGDPAVKLERLAVHFSKLKDELDAQDVRQEPALGVFREQQVPYNDFALDSCGGAAAGGQAGQAGMISNHRDRNGSSSLGQLDADCPMNDEAQYEIPVVTRAANDGSQPSGPARPGSHEYCDLEITGPSPPGGADAAAGPPLPPLRPTVGQRARNAYQRHGREYDFSKQETEREFSAFPGWHSSISELKVKDILEPFAGEEGRYILWYWEELKRPAISITYGGGLKNFIVHKKPRKSRPGEIKYFFINKEQHCDLSMTHLLRFHIQRGIRNTEPDCHHQLIPLHLQVNP